MALPLTFHLDKKEIKSIEAQSIKELSYVDDKKSISSTLLSLILVISYAYIENPVIPKHIIEAKSEHISFS